jgi:hypothetical protein
MKVVLEDKESIEISILRNGISVGTLSLSANFTNGKMSFTERAKVANAARWKKKRKSVSSETPEARKLRYLEIAKKRRRTMARNRKKALLAANN